MGFAGVSQNQKSVLNVVSRRGACVGNSGVASGGWGRRSFSARSLRFSLIFGLISDGGLGAVSGCRTVRPRGKNNAVEGSRIAGRTHYEEVEPRSIQQARDRKSTRLNSSHLGISY